MSLTPLVGMGSSGASFAEKCSLSLPLVVSDEMLLDEVDAEDSRSGLSRVISA